MKAELPDTDDGSPQPSTPATSDSASIAESITVFESSHEGSPENGQPCEVGTTSSSSVAGGKHKRQEITNRTQRSSAGNLVGRINNLVTTDLNNIVDGRDFLMICGSQILAFCVPDLQNLFPSPLRTASDWFMHLVSVQYSGMEV